jgi:hypothetical protein
LKELMSIYKGTFMKLLMKKSDFSAVELRLWNNMTMAFYLNILQVCFIKSFMKVPLYMDINSFKYWTAIYLK